MTRGKESACTVGTAPPMTLLFARHSWGCPSAPTSESLGLSRLRGYAQEEGHHPLIFSQWTSVLDILEWLLDRLQLPYLRLDGSTAVADRLALVDK